MMLSKGEDIGWVQMMLGHSSLQMIFTRYFSWIPRKTRKDGSAFMEAVQKEQEEQFEIISESSCKVIPLFGKSDTNPTHQKNRAHTDEP